MSALEEAQNAMMARQGDIAKQEAEKEEAKKTIPPVARIVFVAEREKDVPLKYPVEFDGKVYESVHIRRATGGEIDKYLIALRSGQAALPPVFDFPMDVYMAMDDDDRAEVEDQARPFLSRRLLDLEGRLQATFESTSDSSPAPTEATSMPSSNGNGST